MPLRIFSFNVNGIRSAISKGFIEWIQNESPDIIGLQEIKANADQFDSAIFEEMGYFPYWFSAEKKGYSGVGLLTRTKPIKVQLGFGHSLFDSEGRVIRADFENFTIVLAYFPSGTSGEIRQEIKMEFLSEMDSYIAALKKEQPHILLMGDYNIAHCEIDINHPKRHTKMSGFLPEEREWFSKFLERGFIDTFRVFNSKPEQYSWWTYRAGARGKNLGWRIDYHLVSEPLRNKLVNAKIHNEVVMSDHCPVSVEIDLFK